MSEKQFVIDHSYLVNYDKYCILDKVEHKHLYIDEVCKKLNEQQSDLNYLARFIGEFKVDEFKEKLRTLRILEDKVDEQQATIDKQERRIMVLENLLTNMGVKWVGDDD